MPKAFTGIFYTYMWLRDDGTPYYVGKGTRLRAFLKHETIKRPSDRSKILLEPHTSEEEALVAERFLVEYYGRLDNGTGCLRNRTDGGDGSSGCRPSKETLLKMRKPHLKLRGRKQSVSHVKAKAEGRRAFYAARKPNS